MIYKLHSKDISIILRYVLFINAYMYLYEKDIKIHDVIDYIIDDSLYDHIDHISVNLNTIKYLFESYKINENLINDKINSYLKNNTINNIGIIGIILKLIINELLIDNTNIHLVMNDYFIICNIYNIPNSYIKMINKIVKSINGI